MSQYHSARPAASGLRRAANSPWFCGSLAVLGGLALLACAALAYLLPQYRPQIVALLETPTPLRAAVAATPACGRPNLQIGQASFAIVEVQAGADGLPQVPAGGTAAAYWLAGGKTHSIFALSDTPQNQALLQAAQAGDPLQVTWESCNQSAYQVVSVESGAPSAAELQDQATLGVLVYTPAGADGQGYVLRGSLQGERLEAPPTPDLQAGERLAEISLLKAGPSADGAKLVIQISVLNYGKSAFSLAAADIQLTPDGGAPLALVQADPRLPAKISPGAARTLTLTFAKPASPAATLKVLEVEFPVEGY